ncbi:hypothetical protein LTR36_001357 [Oleoguttula mirabilis]|uniref:Ubiquitin 3 binding protein But2 C-terminal domain-containing protein n=1 Tax=Oleoguttula mirabilis TaxID=1507867 RepID=A0AAV9JP87_9PEZI|nr:hypothetical protein LTR36_001357 [Oleoguttula mirabilis]
MHAALTGLALVAGAHAAVTGTQGCCFGLNANGGQSGQVGQLIDGQNRIGQTEGSTTGNYCLNNGALTDSNGRGCILTPSTSQFQCDAGVSSSGGFSVDSQGTLKLNDNDEFWACPTGDHGGWNIYAQWLHYQTKCVPVKLTADNSLCNAKPSPSAPLPVPSQPATFSVPEASPPVVEYTSSSWTHVLSKPTTATVSKAATFSVPEAPTSAVDQPHSEYPHPDHPHWDHPHSWTHDVAKPTIATVIKPSAPSVPEAPTPVVDNTPSWTQEWSKPTTESVNKPSAPSVPEAPTPIVDNTPSWTQEWSKPTSGSVNKPSAPSVPQAPTSVADHPHPDHPHSWPQVWSKPATETFGKPAATHPPAKPSVLIETDCTTFTLSQVASHGGHPTASFAPPQPTAPAPAAPEFTSAQPTAPAPPAPEYTPAQPTAPAPPAPAPAAPKGACPAELTDNFEFPHLIVPVDSAHPDKAYGNSLNGTVSDTMKSIFNFDIPASAAGKQCTLQFLLPALGTMETSSYSYSGKGEMAFSYITSPATKETTHNSMATSYKLGEFNIVPDTATTIRSHFCTPGRKLSFMMESTDGSELNYFQDSNQCPIGLYITIE